MNIFDATKFAEWLESLARRADNYDKSREEILEEIREQAKNYRRIIDADIKKMFTENKEAA